MLQTQDYDVKVEVFADNLQIPWAIDFLDTNTALITERPGRLRLVKNGVLQPDPVSGTPDVLNEGQGGLMDVAIDPKFNENGWVYLSYSHVLKETGGERPPAMTCIVRGRIKNNTWVDQQILFEAPHNTYRTARHHYGSRIVFDPQGYLYFSIGDRGADNQAQDIKRPNGKIHRIHTDGRIPQDNPFVAHAGAIPSIFSYGHRNPQGMAVHPMTGQVWVTEHGPMGGDELNLIVKGRNYGWPEITYGRNYNGTLITENTHKDGMEQPSMYWKPSTAVCGLDFYRGNLFPKWRNKLLVGALKYEDVRLLNIENDRVMHEEVIVKNLGRVRDVSTGPDGAIYVVLNTPNIVLRLTPLAESRNQ
jgi:glucose/arabinose dehydrogenase